MDTLLLLGAAAGALASIWGVVTIMAKIEAGVRKWLKERKARREAPMKELLSEMREQRKTMDAMVQRMERMEAANNRLDAGMKRMSEDMGELRKKVDRLDDGVATLQGDRLNQAYDFYVDKRNPCPMAVKASLTEMHAQYTGRGYNHLHQSYIERLEECPTE